MHVCAHTYVRRLIRVSTCTHTYIQLVHTHTNTSPLEAPSRVDRDNLGRRGCLEGVGGDRRRRLVPSVSGKTSPVTGDGVPLVKGETGDTPSSQTSTRSTLVHHPPRTSDEVSDFLRDGSGLRPSLPYVTRRTPPRTGMGHVSLPRSGSRHHFREWTKRRPSAPYLRRAGTGRYPSITSDSLIGRDG